MLKFEVNFKYRGILVIWIIAGQGPAALTVGAGWSLDVFLLSAISLLSPSLWETAQYRLKYCLNGPLNPKQPTNQPTLCSLNTKYHKHGKNQFFLASD